MISILRAGLLGLACVVHESQAVQIQDWQDGRAIHLAETGSLTYLDDDLDYTEMRFDQIADELQLLLAQVRDTDPLELYQAFAQISEQDELEEEEQKDDKKDDKKKDDKKKDDKKGGKDAKGAKDAKDAKGKAAPAKDAKGAAAAKPGSAAAGATPPSAGPPGAGADPKKA